MTKNGNSWEQLLIVIESFTLNDTGLQKSDSEMHR